uniref:DUF1553 domain-containing protein n=1 Tax=Schlesneria paludicola TaxID=360056 RepID=A0A7C2NYX3_9PLAN
MWLAVLVAAQPEDALFSERVAPVLERRCVSCHNDAEAKGGLSLQSADGLRKGGDSGPALQAGRPEASLLLDYLTGDKPEMPKTGPPLSMAEIAALREWIAAGAVWPAGRVLEERPQADLDWWSLQPLHRPEVPAVSGNWARTPVDRFLLATMAARGLSPSPEADRRTLIRRLSYDLLGLPPTPDDVAAFLADDRPDAYERLVDRLLASPHYGERWARHWLDVVHFGETHGYDKDKPRPHAWPYRDYVIRSLNADKPYGRFVAEQLAGDVVAPDTVDGITALGFIAAGPWDFISHVEVPESKTDGRIARSLDRDDMVVNALNTFCSLTVQCARCHAHKFDPVSQTDYYRLQAVFAALDRTDRPFDADPAVHRRRADLLARQRTLEAERDAVAEQIRELGGPDLARITQELADLDRRGKEGLQKPPEHGYHSAIERTDDVAKWVQIDLGEPRPIDRIVLRPCHDDFNGIGAGFGFPRRWKVELSDDPNFAAGVVTVADRTAEDVPNPGLSPQTSDVAGRTARHVRITATKLAPRKDDYIFALAEVQVWNADGKNVAAGCDVTSLDSIEAPIRWRRANLTDGLYPEAAADLAPQRDRLTREREQLLARRVPAEVRQRQQTALTELAAVEKSLQVLPPPQLVYAGTIHHGQGNFRGTGPDGGRPRTIHVLHRGDVRRLGPEVGPGAPPLVPGYPAAWDISPDQPESQRRLALAEWITHTDNPLTWRSIVNRVWQYHFGRGLVDSPNDFGRMGQSPSHPELLDWLAVELRDGGQSLKALHRLIVTSAAYRQVSADRPEAALIDRDNALLWRMNRRKLDAEAVRDSLLFVAGELNPLLGGPSFQDFVVERPEHSPHYEYQLHDPRDPRSHRRSVYRFLVRSQPQPFMTTLDCADPSMSVDKRNETINPLQALALLNNGLTLVMADRFAERVEAPDRADTARLSRSLSRAFELALSRLPTDDELQTLTDYARQHGLANACRVILNLNEFAFVD